MDFLALWFLFDYIYIVTLAHFCKLLFTSFSIAIAVSDLKTGMVPRIFFIAALPIFLLIIILQADSPGAQALALWANFAGAFFGLFIFTIAFFISGRRLGLADIWYSGLIGLLLGPLWWFPAIGIACLAGIIWIVVSKKERIPFIPCMAMGSAAIIILQGWFT
ncbi:MAG: hypothetical protein FWC03_04120 [Treponema sp.]|nr:hypothetical protein [Treponema sp.]